MNKPDRRKDALRRHNVQTGGERSGRTAPAPVNAMKMHPAQRRLHAVSISPATVPAVLLDLEYRRPNGKASEFTHL